jgi:hypothetical protein
MKSEIYAKTTSTQKKVKESLKAQENVKPSLRLSSLPVSRARINLNDSKLEKEPIKSGLVRIKREYANSLPMRLNSN